MVPRTLIFFFIYLLGTFPPQETTAIAVMLSEKKTV